MGSIRTEYPGGIEWINEKEELHRLDGPAVEWVSGDKEWWINGKRHREDGPAYICGNDKVWFLNGIGYTEKRWEEELIKLKLMKIKDL